MATNRLINGQPRRLGGARKAWRAKLDGPTAGYPRFRVHYKEPDPVTGEWEWTSRSPDENTDAAARALFATVEAFLDGRVDHAPASAQDTAARTMEALVARTLEFSREAGLTVRTVEGRESIGRAHVVSTVGKVPVAKWRLSHSQAVIAKASLTCGRVRLEDVRTFLSVMRKVAYTEGWLDRSVDPLDGLTLPRRQGLTGAHTQYVRPELRPERHMVDAAASAADRLVAEEYQSFARFPLLGTMYRVAGYGGLRLGEQLGLRAWDIYFDRGVIEVNGSWTQPRAKDSAPFRGPVKNGRVHDVPVPASLLTALLPRVKDLLGLPATASMQQVLNAQRAERLRRGRRAGRDQHWYDVGVDPADEAWVFVDTTTGLPTRSETVNHYWHKVRRWVAGNDGDHEWPEGIPYRNMRHHAATFWHGELGREWEDVAAFLGDELTTVLNHYVRSGAQALAATVGQLAAW